MQAIREMKDDYNMQLVFAMEKTGAYLADITVTIEDSKGETLVEAVSVGPGFYATLPAGRYKITADNNGTKQVKSINVTGRNLNRLVLYWTPEPGVGKK